MFLAITLLVVFLIFSLLMYLNKLPALLALPLMAVLIAIFAGIPARDILNIVLADGSTRLSVAMITVLFGAMLGSYIAGRVYDVIKGRR